MEQSKIDLFVATNAKNFSADKLAVIKSKLETATDDKFMLLQSVSLKNPTVVWVVSFFLGGLGIDRFMIGSIGAGVVKLLTAGCFGIWWLIDLFIICKKTREANFNKIAPYL